MLNLNEEFAKFLFENDGKETVSIVEIQKFFLNLYQIDLTNEKSVLRDFYISGQEISKETDAKKGHIPIKFNVSFVKDCQDLLDKLIVNLEGLSFYDAKYIAGRLVNEIDKRSMVSVSHSY